MYVLRTYHQKKYVRNLPRRAHHAARLGYRVVILCELKKSKILVEPALPVRHFALAGGPARQGFIMSYKKESAICRAPSFVLSPSTNPVKKLTKNIPLTCLAARSVSQIVTER
jgi:hypothetical protein